jgi:hypothetical protein
MTAARIPSIRPLAARLVLSMLLAAAAHAATLPPPAATPATSALPALGGFS